MNLIDDVIFIIKTEFWTEINQNIVKNITYKIEALRPLLKTPLDDLYLKLGMTAYNEAHFLLPEKATTTIQQITQLLEVK